MVIVTKHSKLLLCTCLTVCFWHLGGIHEYSTRSRNIVRIVMGTDGFVVRGKYFHPDGHAVQNV